LRAENNEIAVLTDNVHSEFMNMLVVGGIPGLTLYVAFIGSILFAGLAVRPRSRALGDAVIGVCIILFVSGMFNSTIKDYGEKHALMIILSILGAQLLGNKRLR
jgi:O-antigen ligase